MRNNGDPWTGTWISPNGVDHAVLNGYCVTCGGLHHRDANSASTEADAVTTNRGQNLR